MKLYKHSDSRKAIVKRINLVEWQHSTPIRDECSSRYFMDFGWRGGGRAERAS